MVARYLDHLADDDLTLLADVAQRVMSPSVTAGRLRAEPALLVELLSFPQAYRAVFAAPAGADPLLRASPFLVFALAVHRVAADLAAATYLPDWTDPRHPLPVFDVDRLRDFVADPGRRLFLAELLGSYVSVVSGSMLVRTARGYRRRRFSELDPVRLAMLLESAPPADRPGIYRRLGDLALFLTGVFPEFAAGRAFGPVEVSRLLRVAGVGDVTERGGGVALLQHLGAQWYRLACATVAAPTGSVQVLADVAERFDAARRVLNVVTKRHLLPFRDAWLAQPGW